MERRIKGVLSPKASGSITITENGNYDVVDVANAVVEVPQPTGEIEITENGEHNVKEYENAIVNVRPSGTIEITENGEHDVANYDKAVVDVKFEDRLKTLLDAKQGCTGLFQGYKGESIVDLIKYDDTENCKGFDSFCYTASNLKYVPKLNYLKSTTMSNAYRGCSSLETIDINHLNGSLTSLFEGCYRLKTIIFRSFGTSYSCVSTTFKNVHRLTGYTHSTYNPNGEYGYIYVPRAMVNTLKSATNWSEYATQIRALEDYTIDGTTTGELDESKIG